MSRRRIKLVDRGRTFVVRGWRGGDLAGEAGVKVVFNGVAQGWVGDGRDLADLLAYLEHRHVGVTIESQGGERP